MFPLCGEAISKPPYYCPIRCKYARNTTMHNRYDRSNIKDHFVAEPHVRPGIAVIAFDNTLYGPDTYSLCWSSTIIISASGRAIGTQEHIMGDSVNGASLLSNFERQSCKQIIGWRQY